jgi:hypothetical protein
METVLPQITTNKDFPKTITNYIIKTDVDILSSDGLYLFSNIFSEELFKNIINEDLINALFNSLSILNTEINSNSFLKMITKIYKMFELENFNVFLNIFKNHQNTYTLTESLIGLLPKRETRDDKIFIYDLLDFIIFIIEHTQMEKIYTNDIESVVRSSISSLSETYTEEMRIKYLKLLFEITKYDEYYKNSYMKNELIEILEDYKDSNNVDDDSKKLAKKVLDNINNH